MASEQKQSKVVEMMATYEEAIGQLYDRYGEKFHKFRDFWLQLSAEEAEHAKCLRLLNQKVQEGIVHIKPNRFNESAIKTSLSYVKRLSLEVEDASTNLLKAISLAVYIEKTLLENKGFEVFEKDCPEMKQTLLLLAEATKEHLDRVEEALGEMKSSTAKAEQ